MAVPGPLLKIVLRARRRPKPATGDRIDPDLRKKAFGSLQSALAREGTPRLAHESVTALRDRVIGDRAYGETQEKADLEKKAFDVLHRALYAKVPPGTHECADASTILDREATRRLEAQKQKA